jgi:hypothetical protein
MAGPIRAQWRLVGARPDERPFVGWAIAGYSDEQNMACRRMFNELACDPAKRVALREHLATLTGEA